MTEDMSELASLAMRALTEARMTDAARYFGEIVRRAPGDATNWFNLGFALRGARDFDGALAAYARSIELDPHPEGALVNRSVIFKDDLGRMDEAEAELRRAREIAPRFVPALFNLGLLHEVVGRRDAARASYLEVVAVEPLHAQAHARLAALEKDPQRGVSHVVGVLRKGRFSQEDAADLEFALANALDRAERYDEAFMVVSRANERKAKLRRPEFRYDPQAHERLIDALIAAFPAAPLAQAHDRDRRPVFICGMFRSGSTVTEQWLARHPHIVAAGELELIPLFVRERLQPYPESVPSLAESAKQALRAEYLKVIDRVAPGARHVTDKRCDNFLHLGLIKTLFPDAVIVHTAREPLDIAVSTYFLDFAEPISYSTSLPDIGHYLVQYRRLMAHWESVFSDSLVRVEYESLVQDPRAALEPVFRALSLDPEQLDPSAAMGAIRTPSAWAARKQLHGGSIGRWRNYEKHLASLREVIGA